MPAGGRHLECPASVQLAPHLGQIGAGRPPGAGPVVRIRPGRRLDGFPFPGAAKEADHRAEGGRADHLDAIDERGLGPVRFGNDDALQARLRGCDGDCQDARRGHQLALQREFAGEGKGAQPRRRHLRGGRQHPERDREVEPRTLFAGVRRRKVHHDPAQRPGQAATLDRRAHPFPSVLHAGARQTRQHQRGKPPADVRLHRDQMTVDPDDRDAEDASVHASQARTAH